MGNGKGSGRRQFNKDLEEAYKRRHPRIFGSQEKVDGRRTKLILSRGKLVSQTAQ